VEILWTLLRERALYVSFAQNAFSFEISWLGIVIILAVALLIRYLRR
jgi:hypothetical protein